jgi:hypothetical protein
MEQYAQKEDRVDLLITMTSVLLPSGLAGEPTGVKDQKKPPVIGYQTQDAGKGKTPA